MLLELKDRLKDDIDFLFIHIKKLDRTVDWIKNYLEEQTGIEFGKELTDSYDSESNSDYTPCNVPINPEKKNIKVIHMNKKTAYKKAKPKRNPTRAI